MTTVLHASDSAAFLRIAPALAGFTPRRSLLLLPFHGTRTHGAMRLDLPGDDVPPEEYARLSLGLLQRVEGTDALAVIVYCDEEPQGTAEGFVLPHAVTVETLLGFADEAGLRIVDALCVAPSGWSSYLDADPSLRPLAEIERPPDVPCLGDIRGDQFAGAALPATDLAERERVGHALSDLTALLDGGRRLTGREHPQLIATLVLLEDVPAFLESTLESPDALPVFATAALLWCLQLPLLRDVAITQWAAGHAAGVRALDAQVAFVESRQPIPAGVGEVFLGRGAPPDAERLRTALAVVRAATARAPRADRPGPLTVAAWLSWALGRATHAGHYLELARDIEPGHRFAIALGALMDAEPLPAWAFRRGDGDGTAASAAT